MTGLDLTIALFAAILARGCLVVQGANCRVKILDFQFLEMERLEIKSTIYFDCTPLVLHVYKVIVDDWKVLEVSTSVRISLLASGIPSSRMS